MTSSTSRAPGAGASTTSRRSCETADINGIENFWNQTKRHLRRFNDVPMHNFHVSLKECAWHFNILPASRLAMILREWLRL